VAARVPWVVFLVPSWLRGSFYELFSVDKMGKGRDVSHQVCLYKLVQLTEALETLPEFPRTPKNRHLPFHAGCSPPCLQPTLRAACPSPSTSSMPRWPSSRRIQVSIPPRESGSAEGT
jgi:hypothetical protein